MTEEQLQFQCFMWHWNTFHSERQMLHHNNNNSHSRNKGASMKGLGVVAGVLDFELILPGGRVAWIELKTPVGRLSDEQKDFIRKITERGHVHFILRTPEEFKSTVNSLYGKD